MNLEEIMESVTEELTRFLSDSNPQIGERLGDLLIRFDKQSRTFHMMRLVRSVPFAPWPLQKKDEFNNPYMAELRRINEHLI